MNVPNRRAGAVSPYLAPKSRHCLTLGGSGRVGRWRGGVGRPCVLPALSVAGARVSAHAPSPPPAHRTGRADLPHPALRRDAGSRPTGRDVTPPLRRPPGSFRRSRFCSGGFRQHGHSPNRRDFRNPPEVRPLPSAGITRPRRYYGPVRLPTRPGLSLAGVPLASGPATAGVSRVACVLPVQTCHRHYPGGIVAGIGLLP
jgi:hypothetical protein